jgi:hypothetical protein
MSKAPKAKDIMQTLSSKESSAWHPIVSVTNDMLHPESNRNLILRQTSFPSKTLTSTTLEPAHHLHTVQCELVNVLKKTRSNNGLDSQIPHRQK